MRSPVPSLDPTTDDVSLSWEVVNSIFCSIFRLPDIRSLDLECQPRGVKFGTTYPFYL